MAAVHGKTGLAVYAVAAKRPPLLLGGRIARAHLRDEQPARGDDAVRRQRGHELGKAVLGVDSLGVNSAHHQAVKDLAPGFRVSATASDGIIEGIESTTLPVAGVQFHPERLVSGADASGIRDNAFDLLFIHLLSLCGQDQ